MTRTTINSVTMGTVGSAEPQLGRNPRLAQPRFHHSPYRNASKSNRKPRHNRKPVMIGGWLGMDLLFYVKVVLGGPRFCAELGLGGPVCISLGLDALRNILPRLDASGRYSWGGHQAYL
jgi:hypothetical protein